MRTTSIKTRLRGLLCGLVPIVSLGALSGCGEMTSASMRVDIDVYQGPLSMEPEAQWGALYGQVEDGLRRLDQIIYATACVKRVDVSLFNRGKCPESNAIVYSEPYTGSAVGIEAKFESQRSKPGVIWDEYREGQGRYLGGRIKQLCSAQDWTDDIKDDKVRALTLDICALRNRLELTFDYVSDWDTAYRAIQEVAVVRATSDPKSIIATFERLDGSIDTINAAELRAHLIEALADVAAIAEEMRIQAIYYATSHVGHASPNRKVRTALVDLSAFAAEYSNALKSRVDALIKQAGGLDRREFSLAAQLRDASPTAYLNLYVWNRAANGRISGETTGTRYFRDRVRVINRLVTDEAWTRVNTAYASGQGDVSMAFIKDDIGNWNLKSFDNDPTELLQAYKEVGKAALGAAVTVASGGSMGSFRSVAAATDALGELSKTQSALMLAENVAYGGGSASIEPVENRTLKRLHTSTLDRLKKLRDDYETEAGQLDDKIEELTKNLNAEKKKVTDAEAEIEAAKKVDPPSGVDGQTVEGLRAESKALESRVVQIEADKEAAETARLNNIEDNEDAKATRADLVEKRDAEDDEAAKAGFQDRIDELDSRIADRDRENEEYGRVIADRVAKASDLNAEAKAASDNADKLERIEKAVEKIRAEKLAPAQAMRDQVQVELDASIHRRDKGLHVEALGQATMIIENHERFVSELEALVVADKAPQAQPTVPIVPTTSP